MKKPSPESSSIITQEFDEFASTLVPSDYSGTLLPADQVERLKWEGKPLFTEKEVNAAYDPLMYVFRRLCVDEHITEEYFTEKYKNYAINVLGKTPQGALNNRTNILKQLKKFDTITAKRFYELTELVLGIKPEWLHMRFVRMRDKSEFEISTKPKEK
jgi:hypothetical protein